MYSTNRPVVTRTKPSVVGSAAGNQNPTHFCHGERYTGSGAVSGSISAAMTVLTPGDPNDLTPRPPSLKRKGENEAQLPSFSPFLFREGGRGVRFCEPSPQLVPVEHAALELRVVHLVHRQVERVEGVDRH